MPRPRTGARRPSATPRGSLATARALAAARVLAATAAVAGAAWGLLRLAPAGWVDGPWAHGVLPLLTAAARPWLVASPLSLTAVTVVAASIVVAVVAARLGGWRGAALLLCALAVAAAGFEASWSVGYRRTPLETRLSLPTGAPTATDLAVATERVAAIAAAAAPDDPAAVDVGAPWPRSSWAAAAACVADADAVVSARARPLALAPTVRRLPDGLLLASGFAGFVGPWWREPHVDGALPPVAARATALHELVHAAGWAREAETDALGVLAGLRCADREVRFAAAVHALGLLRAERARFDPDALSAVPEALDRARAARMAELPAAVARADAALRAAAAAHARPALRRAVGATYDVYLRAQGLEAGLADYGRAGVLVVAALAHCDGSPGALLCPEAPAPPP
jgi:hypothetical protein